MDSCNLAITSDYYKSTGNPRPYLKKIAEAGFTHIHWCHHWNTDFLYSKHEIKEIRKWLKEYGLSLLNLHASHGNEKYWLSDHEYQRQAGIELVKNRLKMTARLGADVMILHIPTTLPKESRPACMVIIRRSLDQLEPFARSHSVRIALENMDRDDFEMLDVLLGDYSPTYIGLCFDSGHANLDGMGLGKLEHLKERLIAVHLHDNDGSSDQHAIPLTGTVDWARLTSIIASSSCDKPLNLEVVYPETGYPDEEAFLMQAHQAGISLSGMVEASRKLSNPGTAPGSG